MVVVAYARRVEWVKAPRPRLLAAWYSVRILAAGVQSWVDTSILKPGRNVWRLAHAERVAVLVDAAAYCAAFAAAVQEGKHSLYILGWDLDSRTDLSCDGGLEPPR